MSLYRIDILDSNLNYKATVRNLQSLNKSGTFLKYNRKLSNWGIANFRVGTKDPLFTTEGDLLRPHANHVRIYRANVQVWQGVIVKNPSRNKNYIDVEARTYEWLLNKNLIVHDTSAQYPDDKDNFRHFTSGGMDTVITTLLSEAKANMGASSFIQQITAGAIGNPNFPQGYIDVNNNNIGGQPWDFSKIPVKFNYNTFFYVLSILGIYSKYDFTIDNNLKLNFQPLVGNNNPSVTFRYGAIGGQVVDYNIPLDGTSQVNELTGLAADSTTGDILKDTSSDLASIATYGKLQGVAAFADIKDKNYLHTRDTEELRFTATPDNEIHLTLNNTSTPLGLWGIGDQVTVQINDHINQINAIRQIIFYETDVFTNDQELVQMITNIPRVV